MKISYKSVRQGVADMVQRLKILWANVFEYRQDINQLIIMRCVGSQLEKCYSRLWIVSLKRTYLLGSEHLQWLPPISHHSLCLPGRIGDFSSFCFGLGFFFLKMYAIKEDGKVLEEVHSLTGCAISQVQIRDNGDWEALTHSSSITHIKARGGLCLIVTFHIKITYSRVCTHGSILFDFCEINIITVKKSDWWYCFLLNIEYKKNFTFTIVQYKIGAAWTNIWSGRNEWNMIPHFQEKV